jgi:phosphatidylglycerophosphate synthase
MLDRAASALIKPFIAASARGFLRLGLTANSITLLGFTLGLGAAACIAAGYLHTGLALILTSRWLDGVDGAVARLTQATDRGGFLDITLDFLFYASIPLAFALHAPAANALPAAVLLAAFVGTASSFLAYAVFATKRGVSTTPAYPNKSFAFASGLAEATETLICFCLMCLLPAYFAWWAYGFAALCGVTVLLRLMSGWRAFRD